MSSSTSASGSSSNSSSSSSFPSSSSSQPEASSSKTQYIPHLLYNHPSTSTTIRDQEDYPNPELPPRPTTLREPPASDLLPPSRQTLTQFRQSEGPLTRAGKLKSLWEALPTLPEYQEGPTATKQMQLPGQDTVMTLSPERVDRLRNLYLEELVRECNDRRPNALLWGGSDDWKPETTKGVAWEDFRRFLWDKERELWDTFQDLDKNGDGRLDAVEIRAALSRSGVDITPGTVEDLVRHLAHGSSSETLPQKATLSQEDMYITFGEFRDFLIMLPRRATPFEIYKYYQVKTRYSDGRGAARVDKEGDINVSFPRAPGSTSTSTALFGSKAAKEKDQEDVDADDFGDTVEEASSGVDHHEAWRFLLAGGVAGAVSRSVTAPFDRLKIYLITTDAPRPIPGAPIPSRNPLAMSAKAVQNLYSAMGRIYLDGGGIKAFWVGNGLNVIKIFPESAIKFVSYEQSKKFLARYWDGVSDVSELSSSSRFLAGGIGGITSQFAIYGLETLKTRVQSEIGPAQGMKAVGRMARTMWASGGIRAYYRGLTLGLIGVFPYSAIDMGTYETLRRAYVKSTGCDEPGVMATLSFGALSGSIGAASVYPVNLLRTRLQAAGSSGHQHHYTGFVDVAQQTLRNEGWRGLYKGLLPSILKVGPAVGVSWIVYEDMKRRLGV